MIFRQADTVTPMKRLRWFALPILLLASHHLKAVTHDDSEQIIPEFYVRFKGTGVGSAKMTVSFTAYDEAVQGTLEPQDYVETTGELSGPSGSTAWTDPTSLFVKKGMPLDVAGTLDITGNNVAEYQIFINVPDSKYIPHAYVQMPDELYTASERFMIAKQIDAGLQFSHKHYVLVTRAAAACGPAGKVSSAMAGWRNMNISLGTGRSGKDLGYMTFWKGNELNFLDFSMEVKATNYTSGGVAHAQLTTPQFTFDLYRDATYAQSGFLTGAYRVRGYDNRTQLRPTYLVPEQGGIPEHYEFPATELPVVSYVLNFAGPEELGSQANAPECKTRVLRTEGSSEMVSEAFFQATLDQGWYTIACFPGAYVPGFYFNGMFFPPISFPGTCVPVWLRQPSGTLRSFTYDWLDSGGSGARNCRAGTEVITWDASADSPSGRTLSLAVGLGTPMQYTLSRTDSGRFESSGDSDYESLDTELYFWKKHTTRSDAVDGTSASYLNGSAAYYFDTGATKSGGHLKLRSRVEPGGTWTYYDYYSDFAARGMVKRVVRPFKDAPSDPPTSANAQPQGALITDYTYTDSWDGSKTLPWEVITRLKGDSTQNDMIISITRYEYATETYGGLNVLKTTRKDYFGPGLTDYSTTITKRFRADANRMFAGLPFSEEHPDGTKDQWNYDAGDFVESDCSIANAQPHPPTVLHDNPNAAVREWKVKAFSSAVDGAIALGIDGSYVVPGVSTAERRTRDQFGKVRRVETLVCSGLNPNGSADWASLDTEIHDYDLGGNLILSRKLMTSSAPEGVWHTVYEAQYTDRNAGNEDPLAYAQVSFDNTIPSGSATIHWTGRKQYERDRAGVVRKFNYDEYGRVKKVTELRAPEIGGLSSPPALQTQYTYDADHRVLTTSVGPPTTDDSTDSNALVTSQAFNLAGLPTTAIAPGGYTTTTAYNQTSSRTLTQTAAGLGGQTAFDRTTVTTRYRDGQAKSVAGTANVPQFNSPSIQNLNSATLALQWHPDNGSQVTHTVKVGTLRLTTSRGSSTALTTRSVTQDMDGLGRVVREEEANPTVVGSLETKTVYNNKAQVARTETSGLAPVLFEYNDYGQLYRSGLKLGASPPSQLVEASMDRISDQITFFWRDPATDVWWEVTHNQTYPHDNSATDLVVQTTLQQRSGFRLETLDMPQHGPLSDLVVGTTIVIDPSNVQTTTLQILDRSHGFSLSQVASTTTQNPDNTGFIRGRKVYHLSPDLVREDFAYDTCGRPYRTSARPGTTELVYRVGSTEVQWQRNPDNTWSRTEYDPAGRVKWQKVLTNYKNAAQPADTEAGTFTRFNYNQRGQVVSVWGDTVYPLKNTYYTSPAELDGELYEQHTYNSTDCTWNGETWPDVSTLTANKIRYVYYEQNGLLKEKRFYQDTGYKWVAYAYNKRRDLATRTWQRGKSTTYSYEEAAGSNTGELRSVDYSDPQETDLLFTYTRVGALKTVTDATGVRTYTYRPADLQLDYADLPTATYGSGMKVGHTYDAHGRFNGYWLGSDASGAPVHATYGYDPVGGRLCSIDTPLGTFNYAYLANGHQIAHLNGPSCNSKNWMHDRAYAPDSELLDTWSSTLGSESLAAFSNRYDNRHRLEKIGQTGRLYAPYGSGLSLKLDHNDRNELINATTYLSGSPDSIVVGTTPKLPRREFGFTYDSIGNRKETRVDGAGALTYTPNQWGQYTRRIQPAFIEINGLVHNDTTLTAARINGANVTTPTRLELSVGDYDYYSGTPTRSIPSKATRESVAVDSTLTGSGVTLTGTSSLLARSTTEDFAYDDDGNLTSDSLWTYTYDSENRVKQIEIKTALLTQSPAVPGVRVKFAYDFLGRRVKKEVYVATGTTYPSTPSTTRLFVYDGWNLIAEYSQSGTTRSLDKGYYWGLDLSGSLQGAAGVGGLLGFTSHLTNPGRYLGYSDSQGNVIGLVDANLGIVVAEYEYSPYGELLRASGPLAGMSPWRFSTKYFDVETGLLNFGYRYYSPSLGRFLNRDPKDEPGRLQLAAPLMGGGVPAWSYLGRLVGTPGKSPGLTPDTSLARTSLPHSNDRQGEYRNSTAPHSTVASRKGNGSGGSSDIMTPYVAPRSGGGSHLYGYVGNKPYGSIDPLGLWEWRTSYWNPGNWLGLSGTSWGSFWGASGPGMSWGQAFGNTFTSLGNTLGVAGSFALNTLIGENYGAAWRHPLAAMKGAVADVGQGLIDARVERDLDGQINDNKYGHSLQISRAQRDFGLVGTPLVAAYGPGYEIWGLFFPGHTQDNMQEVSSRPAPFFGLFDGQNPLNWLWDTPGDLLANIVGQVTGVLQLPSKEANLVTFLIPGPNYSSARNQDLRHRYGEGVNYYMKFGSPGISWPWGTYVDPYAEPDQPTTQPNPPTP